MKLRLILVALLLPLLGYTQEKRNTMSVSAGVWGTDLGYFNPVIDYSFGPVFALEYQRILTDYVAVKGKLSVGVISRKQYMETSKESCITVGVMFIPFGKKFRNFQIGIASGYICNQSDCTNLAIPDEDQNLSRIAHSFGIEFPVRFHFIDNERYILGIGFDVITGFNAGRYHLYTLQSMLSCGLKF